MADKHDFLLNAGVKIDASQASNEVKDFVESVKSSFQNTKVTDNLKSKIQELGATAVKNGKKITEFYKEIGNQKVRFNVTKSGKVELGKDKIVYEDITALIKTRQKFEKESDKHLQAQKDAYKKISDKIFIMRKDLEYGVYNLRDFFRISSNIDKLKLGVGSLTAEDSVKAKKELSDLSILLEEQEKKFANLGKEIREAMVAAGEGPLFNLKEKIRDINSQMKSMALDIMPRGMKGEDVSDDINKLKELAVEAKEAKVELLALDGQLNVTWAEITGGAKGKAKAELDVLKAQLASFKDQFMILGETSGPVFESIKQKAFETQKQIEKLTKKVKPSQIKKLATTIKRVGFYRIARNIFKTIENGFREFQTQLVSFGDHINTTVSQTNTAIDKINASFALILSSLSGLVSPIFNDLADGLANFSNNLSKTVAVIKGQNTYLSISKDYWHDMAEEANSLNASFDKFETLSGDSKGSIFEEIGISKEEAKDVGATELAKNLKKIQELDLTKTLEDVFSIVKNIWNIIKTITPAIKTIVVVITPIIPILTQIIVDLVELAAKIILVLDEANLLLPVIIGIGVAFIAIKFATIVDGFKKIGSAMKSLFTTTSSLKTVLGSLALAFLVFKVLENAPEWAKYLMLIAGAMVAVAGAILATREAFKGIAGVVTAIGLATALGASLSIVAKNTANSVPKMKDGGVLPKGTPFIAGEAGAELVHSMPNSNKTGVTNIEQFTQAMINANYQSSGLFQSIIESALSNCGYLFETNIDGAAVARSKSFKNELNRTNSGLNLK